MSPCKVRSSILLIAFIALLFSCPQSSLFGQGRPFTVKDDILLAKFGNVIVSPAQDMVVVQIERGSLKDGKLHDQLQIYDLSAVRKFSNAVDQSARLVPLWCVDESAPSAGKDTTIITDLRWLADGSGVAFLLRTDTHRRRLYVASIRSKHVTPLSPEGDNVLGFDIRDPTHYVLTLASHEAAINRKHELEAPYRVGTGHTFYDLAFPEIVGNIINRGELWAATGGALVPVVDRSTGKPIGVYADGSEALSLSPDGRTAVTVRPVEDVPVEWESLFPPPFPNDPYRLRTMHQDLNVAISGAYVGEYVRIALSDGSIRPLVNAPTARRAGWWEVLSPRPRWSDDGSNILLPSTFIENESRKDIRPCVVVVSVISGRPECVKPLHRELASGYEEGFQVIDDATFASGRNDEIILRHTNHDGDGGDTFSTYRRSPAGHWMGTEGSQNAPDYGGIAIKVSESFNKAPVLIVTDTVTRKSRVVIDPNPQLKEVALGESEIYAWQDKSGRRWQGILYKPIGFRSGKKYPLVIQNHGFSINRYVPSGGFTSAFVAEELASAGIMVLHVRDCPGRGSPAEGPCNVEGYESAVEKLTGDGLVDSSRVGIIGFSRTVFYVLEALTISKIRFKAASITDGITLGYLDYLTSIDQDRDYLSEQVAMIGSEPIGDGLKKWTKYSPDFNLDRVNAPLRIVARNGNAGVIGMWEPYALLESMHKPVDLIVLNAEEHVISNPTIRLAAQGGNVDWFRFWLQDFEDPDPVKKDQYVRWRHLRDLRDADATTRQRDSSLPAHPN